MTTFPDFHHPEIRPEADACTEIVRMWGMSVSELERVVSKMDDVNTALVVLAKDSIMYLDAARAAADAGRPPAVLVLLRVMWENQIAALTCATFVDEKNRSYAKRYLAYGEFVQGHVARAFPQIRDAMIADGKSEAEADQQIATWISRSEDLGSEFSFKYPGHWSPEGRVADLADRLWPENAAPAFDVRVLGKGSAPSQEDLRRAREMWVLSKKVAWDMGSDHVHSRSNAPLYYGAPPGQLAAAAIAPQYFRGYLAQCITACCFTLSMLHIRTGEPTLWQATFQGLYPSNN